MKKAKVLLVSPNLKGMADGVNRIQPSLGLMLIAQVLIENGHEVKIIDTALNGWQNREFVDLQKNKVMIGQSDKDIMNLIDDFSPDVLGISVLFSNFLGSAHQIARLAKKVNKNINVILGGNHISNAVSDYKYSLFNNNSKLPDTIEDLENNCIDFALIGEGEFSFLSLVDALMNDLDVSKVSGLVKKTGDKKFLINPTERINDLNVLPRPARHLVDMEAYFKIGAFHSAKSRSKRVLSVMCSRGCPEKCTFCTTPDMWGNNTRWRNTKHIMDEIKNDVKEFNIGEIQFEDDTITVNKKGLYELCTELEKIGLPWCTPNGTKVNYHFNKQEEMYNAMYNSGCYQITLACESGVQRVLDDVINKRLPKETIYPSIENAKKSGMLVHTFWILGYPGETYEEMEKTIDFASNSGADSYSFAILSPLPGTPIYRDVMKNNLWWKGRGLKDLLYRSSLIQVDGFTSPEEFENYVDEANRKTNLLLKDRDPKRFAYKYGSDADKDSAMLRQT